MAHVTTDLFLRHQFRATARMLAGLAFLVGLLVVLGWVLDYRPLKSFHPGLGTMKANTAISVLLIAFSVWLVTGPNPRFSRWILPPLSFAGALIGILTLAQYFLGWNLGIDQLLFAEAPYEMGTFHPGRMGPNTAIKCILLGFALPLIFWGRFVLTGQAMALCAEFISLLALLGYLYRIDEFYGISYYTESALPTGISWILLGAAVLLAFPERGLTAALLDKTLGGVALRRLLPTAIMIPVLLGFLNVLGHEQDFYAPEFAVALFAVVSVPLFAFVIWVNARSLHVLDLRQQEAHEALQEKTRTLEATNEINLAITAELDLHKVVQTVTDSATRLSGAEFGAFFYNVESNDQKAYNLFAVSGVPREAFEKFPVPRNTELFAPTVNGEQVVRIEDVTKDEQFGRSAPYYGMLEGHLPVRSYLAAPVISRSGDVIGGLFFGHAQPGIFTEKSEQIVRAIAIQAAIALDNSRLWERAQRDLEQRKKAEERLQDLNANLEQQVAERTAQTKRQMEQLRILTAELIQAEQRERQRLALAMHDDLLQMIITSKLLLESIPPESDEQYRQNTIHKIIDLLGRSIRVARTLTQELSPQVLDLGLPAALNWLAEWMREKFGLQVEIQVDERADPDTENLRLLLFRAAHEFLFNVIRHAGVNKAQLRTVEEDGRVGMEVVDQGAGFDPKRVAQEGREHFGLFSVKQRVEALGGTFELTSSPGQGTRVRILGPEETPAPAPVAESARQAPVPTQEKCGRIRVLLVDDQDTMRHGLQVLLDGEEDIEVVGEAASGEEAIAETGRLQPDVVIMDVSMRGMTGIEATRRIRSQFPHIVVIGLSMYDQDAIVSAMRNAGAVDFLTKGGPSTSLLASIRNHSGSAAASA